MIPPETSSPFEGKTVFGTGCDRCIELERIISIYHIQFEAAMKATSLGLCKRVIKHAIEDEQNIRRS